MGRNSTPSEIDETGINNTTTTTTTTSAADGGANGGNGNNNNDQGFHSIRDRLRFKRNPIYTTTTNNQNRATTKSSLDRSSLRNRLHHNTNRSYRKGFFFWFPFRAVYLFYFVIFFAVFAFMASMVLQSSITTLVFTKGWSEHRRSIGGDLRLGSTLKFFPGIRSWRYAEGHGLDQVRLQGARVGFRAPRLAIILGNMKIGPQSLMLISVMKNLQQLGYVLKIYAVENGKAQSLWEQIGGQISILQPKQYGHIDWSIFEGVIVDSLEGKEAILSLMQEPFCSVPLIWIIQEDTLANRLSVYEEMGWEYLVSHWRRTCKRANVVVFPDFTMPMLYSVLDTGNFFVIPGSPVDVWAAERYSKTHAKHQLRTDNGFSDDDIVVVVVGSSFFYDELSLDYAVAIHSLGPLLVKYARRQDAEGSFKFIFLCGNSTDGDALQMKQ